MGIIHGDIKSLNVMRSSSGDSKVHVARMPPIAACCLTHQSSLQLCDFGGAVQVLATAMSTLSAGGLKMATPAWTAPEMFTGSPKSHATDMYALGVFMWELMTCEVPFEGVAPNLIGDQVKAGVRPRIPSPAPEGFSPEFIRIIEDCWRADAAQRPSAKDVHARLLQLDSTSRTSAPLQLFDHAHTHVPASLLRCVLEGMQAEPSQPNAGLVGMLTTMVDNAERHVKASRDVQQLCRDHGITEIEAQALTVYTMDATAYGESKEKSVYHKCNSDVRSGDAAAIRFWSAYSLLLSRALDKLPSVACTVYRGLSQPLTQLSHEYAEGRKVWYNAVTSTTTDKQGTLTQFGAGGTLLQMRVTNAKDISAFSVFPGEHERLLPHNSCHFVETALASAKVARCASCVDCAVIALCSF